MILSQLSKQDLIQGKAYTGYPKWDNLIHVNIAGLKTLDAMFIYPHSSGQHIEKSVVKFASYIGGFEHLMIRNQKSLEDETQWGGIHLI